MTLMNGTHLVLLQALQLVLRERYRLVKSHLHNDGCLEGTDGTMTYTQLHVAFILGWNRRIHKEKRSHIEHVLDLLFLVLHVIQFDAQQTLFLMSISSTLISSLIFETLVSSKSLVDPTLAIMVLKRLQSAPS